MITSRRAGVAGVLFLVSLVGYPVAAVPGQATKAAVAPSTPPVSELPPAQMTTYFMGFLKKGASWTPVTPENEAAVMEIQRGHMAHLNWMGSTKKLVLAGPFLDNQDIRGILIFRTASIDEARAMAEQDPAVKAGRLLVELHPWLVQEGILPDTLEAAK